MIFCRGGAPAPPAWDSVCVIDNTGRPIRLTVMRQHIKNVRQALCTKKIRFSVYANSRPSFYVLFQSLQFVMVVRGYPATARRTLAGGAGAPPLQITTFCLEFHHYSVSFFLQKNCFLKLYCLIPVQPWKCLCVCNRQLRAMGRN